MKPSYTRLIVGASIGLVVAILCAGTAEYVVLNPQPVKDQLRVWAFKPTAAITEQVHRDQMTPEGKFLYLASHPSVESKRSFNQICGAVTTDTSILGCYIDSNGKIYLYHETDPRLDGTEEVMAAHEMLRAAWARMSPAERAPLQKQLDRILLTNKSTELSLSPRYYDIKRDQPGDENGELYAIVGTEVPDVGSTLETSYGQYLAKRSAVTALAAHSRAYVIAVQKKVAALTATMDALNDTLDQRSKAFNSAIAKLNSDIDHFNARANTMGGFTSQGQFEAARNALIARGNVLKKTQAQINAQVDEYNKDLKDLSALSKTAAGLMKNLNVELDPLPGLTA